ncbi:hypothetical protein SALBM311S_04262 [Streptomyces alboniger]
MIQIGAYSEFWPDIHMTAEEGMRAHLDLQGGQPHGVMLPIHWATFNLATHAWTDRRGHRRRVCGEGSAIALPRPGQPFERTGETVPADPWWRGVALEPAGGWPVAQALGDAVAEATIKTSSDSAAGDQAKADTASDISEGRGEGTGDPKP